MQKTKIEYLTHTWNPIAMRCWWAGAGCRNCWHLRMADRLAKNPAIDGERRAAYRGGSPVLLRDELDAPLNRRKPAIIGVQFMGDLFHPPVSLVWQARIFSTMMCCPHHRFVVLTKRPWLIKLEDRANRVDLTIDLMLDLLASRRQHIYIGVSAWDQASADEMVPPLLEAWPGPKVLSIEPMLSPIQLRHEWLKKLDWVIVGAETGFGKRKMRSKWAEWVYEQCEDKGVPFFGKVGSDGKPLTVLGNVVRQWPKQMKEVAR